MSITKMMKKSLIILLLINLCIIFTSCSSDDVDSIAAREICNFVRIFKNVYVGFETSVDIFVDINSGVIYIYIRTDQYRICPIYNTDGSLKIWRGEMPE